MFLKKNILDNGQFVVGQNLNICVYENEANLRV